MSTQQRIESRPVVLIHILDHGLTMCSGGEWDSPSDEMWTDVPRQLCPGCNLAMRKSW